MKTNLIKAFLIFLIIIIGGCDQITEEKGQSKIYFTNIEGEFTNINLSNSTIDKESKTVKYSFGINCSGYGNKDSFKADILIDYTDIPENYTALNSEEFSFLDQNGNIFPDEFSLENQNNIYLVIPEKTIKKYSNSSIAIKISIKESSSCILNDAYMATIFTLNTSEYSSFYEDITDKHLKNFKAPFEATDDSPPAGSCDKYIQTPTEWTVNDALKIHEYEGKMYGGLDSRCWSNRSWLGSTNYDFYTTIGVDNGKLYQTINLPSGKYKISANIVEIIGGPGHSAIVVSKGKTIPNYEDLDTATEFIDFATAEEFTFELVENTEVSIGCVFKVPVGLQSAYSFNEIRLLKETSVFD